MAAANDETLLKTDGIQYKVDDPDTVIRDYQSVFHNEKEITTKPLSFDAGNGKIITKIVLKKDNQVLQTINVNAQTYNNILTLHGEPVPVKSVGNVPWGTWFAWDRKISGEHWTPGEGGHWKYDIPGENSDPGSEEIGGLVRDAWPGKKVILDIPYQRKEPYRAVGGVDYGNIPTSIIDGSSETLRTANPLQVNVNVSLIHNQAVIVVDDHGNPVDPSVSGYTDPSTVISGLKIIDLDKASIEFKQNYDHEGLRKKIAPNGSSATMYYFALFKFDIKSYTYRYPNVYEVYVKNGTATPPPPTPTPTPEAPTVVCTDPAPGQVVSGEFLDPGVAAEIRADQRGNEQFDVLQGIPSSESLYGHASTKGYLYQNRFVEMKGTCTYDIKIQKVYTLKWDPTKPAPSGPGTVPAPTSEPKPVVYSYSINRPYSYWTIDTLEVYALSKAVLRNDALSGGAVTLKPNGYTPPDFSTEITGKYIPPEAPDLITVSPSDVQGGTTRPEPDNEKEVFQSKAEEAAKKIKVQNDTFDFIGQTIMDGSEATEAGQSPGTIPNPQPIGDYVLYSPGNIIEPAHLNAPNLPSSGEITYIPMDGNINGGTEDKVSPIDGINSITVHTPVVNYSLLPDDNRPFDQRMVPDLTRTVLILDRPFTVHFTESGQHLNIPGYGNRDYAKYTKNKRIQFPFGVFQDGQYYPENTWIYIPVGTPSMTFTMPTWVNEGDYTINTQSWAINAPSDGTDLCEVNLNGDLTNYCASESFNVGVVGRLFNFRIWDIGDFRFEKVFRTGVGTLEHSTAMYYTGGNDENGNPTAISGQPQWQLPIRKGSHPNEQLTVPHNGYSFLFDFRTMGNLWQPGEGIRIEPSFYFIPKSGGSPTPVDLYYDISGSNNKMIGVGSSKDKLSYTRTYRLADDLRNISSGELSTAASYEYNYILNEQEREKTPWLKFYKQYVKRKTKLATGYDLEVLPYKSRTLVGPTDIPNGVDPIAAVRSVQHWYGEYNLPISPYILPKGTNIVTLANQYGGALDGHEKEFIKGGYILVKFGIYTVKNGDADTRILGYKAPIANMWAIEGQMTGDTDERGQTFSFSSGDIILFESDYSVRNDYQGQGR
ncbi:hypothetical protein A3844_19230 [Paenibacillus helianthi]|uniref:DUF5704 domain-containing protein n=1 Tax=Paenibacillus helianthi TaxID=1349432 RepID=A0ABX3EMZ6_9BACL|nr:DUF5704 domain-containing protein [Paenibacillus helianthi]OKP84623.1 hypothetical protein A3844_19230 [Paenibacillus helianthi]